MAVGRVAGTGNIGYSSNYRGGGKKYFFSTVSTSGFPKQWIIGIEY